ncbi:MAG: hypothetical protein ACR2FN_01400 [Chitinophagaceae bacterium]
MKKIIIVCFSILSISLLSTAKNYVYSFAMQKIYNTNDTMPVHSSGDTMHQGIKKMKTQKYKKNKKDSTTHSWHEGVMNDSDSTGSWGGKTDSTKSPH